MVKNTITDYAVGVVTALHLCRGVGRTEKCSVTVSVFETKDFRTLFIGRAGDAVP
ncbi:MAG: hypothetical protein FWB96_08260 [Defluviitaleaceae bacterium]|nr:hypothetical protein [Defluviitaleaceae bacterium]MCL2224943.1 hypothetical protein [Defluviitaleaceae bacterium]